MEILNLIKESYNQLNSTNKRKYLMLVLSQMILGFLDLFAIIILGLFSFFGSAYLGVTTVPIQILDTLNRIGLPTQNLGKTAVILILAAAVLLLSKSAVSIFVLHKIFTFLAHRSSEISSKFAAKFMNSSQALMQQHSSQEATFLISRGFHVSEILGANAVILSEVATLFLLASFLLFSDPLLAVTLFFYFLSLQYFSQIKLGAWMRESSLSFAKTTILGDQVLQDGILLRKELFVANKLGYIVSKFSKFRMVVSKSSANMQLINYIPKLTFESALIIGACLVGIQQVVFGTVQTAISTLVIFITAGSRILPSLLRIQSAASAIQGVSGSSKLAMNLLKKLDSEELKPSNSVFNGNQESHNFNPTLELKNVNFSYGDAGEFSIKDLSLKISAGSSLAIVGRSGSGKSTLVDLMLGVLNPDSGSVLINDGSPILSIEKKPGCIGYVPQTVAFVNGDVKENVAIGVETSEINEDLVWKCLELAQMDELFRDSLKGLETSIGERGIRLSGGQRQRLGIARALYSQPQILILDEATSALDAETEMKISETLDLLSNKITLVVIAHRISTIKKLEKVIYLDGGVIRAIGSFDEVRSAVPDFERQAKLLGL